MCTYIADTLPAAGSGKGPAGWFSLSRSVVFYDHPYHAPLEHSLNIDFSGSEAAQRVAVELTPESARALALAILATLDQAAGVGPGVGSPA
jgi:hypothetical protein